jgi:phosphoribosylpyrophosphate synthetase
MMMPREESLNVVLQGLSGWNGFHLVSTDLHQPQKQEIFVLNVHNVMRW